MGYNARNDEIRDNVTRMRGEWEPQRGALATIRHWCVKWTPKGFRKRQAKVKAATTPKARISQSNSSFSPSPRSHFSHRNRIIAARTEPIIISAVIFPPEGSIHFPPEGSIQVFQNLGIMIGGKDRANQTTAIHTIATRTAITTKIRSPFDMGEEPVPAGSPLSIYVGGGGGGGGGGAGGLGTFLRKERFHIVGPQCILSPLHYRTTKLASKVLSRDQIGKTPSDIEAASLIAPAATAHCFNVSRPVPLVHIV